MVSIQKLSIQKLSIPQPWGRLLGLGLVLTGLLGAGPVEQPRAPAAGRVEAKERGQTSHWLLAEFDWGDDEEVVAESVLFDPHFSCKGTATRRCVLVSTVVDREQLLARFHHDAKGGLWEVVVLTPDLNRAQAEQHLGRVWKVLVDYVTRMKGEPVVTSPLPHLDDLEFGPPRLTHFWETDDLEVRIRVGRRDVDLFYVGAYFSDPVRGAAEQEAQDARVAQSDERLRRRRAGEAVPRKRPN